MFSFPWHIHRPWTGLTWIHFFVFRVSVSWIPSSCYPGCVAPCHICHLMENQWFHWPSLVIKHALLENPPREFNAVPYIFTFIYIYVHIYVNYCKYISIYVFIFYLFICLFICIYIHTHIYIYINEYIYIMYTHIYIYIAIPKKIEQLETWKMWWDIISTVLETLVGMFLVCSNGSCRNVWNGW
jgi:hypothetical protein